MITIQHNQSLQSFNTFGIDEQAERFVTVHSIRDIQQVLLQDPSPTVIGGGSNFLLTQPLSGITIKNEIKGITIVEENENDSLVAVQSGENWHEFVTWAVNHELGGIENMALIPGTVGAAPIQNIGAYGRELKDVFVQLEALSLQTGKIETFSKADCEFGYRDSIFKRHAKGKYFITTVYLRLQSKPHRLYLDYGAIQQELTNNHITQPTIKDVYQTVIRIRESKLPSPHILGNAGSFFKNPVISTEAFHLLQSQYPQIPHYTVNNMAIKIPAAWLIDQCGWKGKQIGQAGCYQNQPLVLVNHGNAKGSEILHLAKAIQASVVEKFAIALEMEVNIW